MKKVVLVVLLVMFAVSAQAREITAGTVKLSGATNAGFLNSTMDVDGDEEADVDTLSLETSAVYFLTNNIGVGGTITYENEDAEYGDGTKEESTLTIIGPTVAADVPLNENLNFIADAGVGYFKMEGEDSDGNWDADGFAYGLSAGVAMFPAKQVSLDLTVKYEVLDGSTDDDIDIKLTNTGLAVGVSVYFD